MTAEDEARQLILSQPVGPHTLESYHLPDDFLSRVADRAIRASYEARFRIVVQDDATPHRHPAPNDLRPIPPPETGVPDAGLTAPTASGWPGWPIAAAGAGVLIAVVWLILRRSAKGRVS